MEDYYIKKVFIPLTSQLLFSEANIILGLFMYYIYMTAIVTILTLRLRFLKDNEFI